MTTETRGRSYRFSLRTMFALVTALAGLIWIAMSFPWPVSSDRVRGVNIGMTESQVIEVMGRQGSPSRVGSNGEYCWVWSRDGWHVAVVIFSPDGKVTDRFND